MKKPITFEQASLENKERFVMALPYITGSRKPRTKPRSIEESIGISIATAEVVQKALQSGRLIRKPLKGFVLNELKR
ncbi:MAG: hypothetical protein RO469_16670 [Thermincola sp.]|jgi:hypothetical protein|nr:hypothetical protein [Thermincola sp.]MDT3702740.1 hypothetical protein [Thermincola sp.]